MRIGVCGAGTVASWVSGILNELKDEEIELYACSSARGTDCSKFAEKFHYTKACKSYVEMLRDPMVDIVYLAVPNHIHFSLAKQAIEAGKNVICEKPLAMNESECRELFRLAKENDVFLMEALWAAFLPIRRMVYDIIRDGRIGEVKEGHLVQMDNIMFLPRALNPDLGGGYLLDNGPYTIGWMVDYFGTDIKRVEARMRMLDSGVDGEDWLTVEYADGRSVTIHQALDSAEADKAEYAEIIGSKGKIWFDAVANPKRCIIYDKEGAVLQELKIPPQIKNPGIPPVSGYNFEFEAAKKALKEGRKECKEASFEKSLAIARVMTEARKQCGFRYPFEQEALTEA